MRFIIGLLLGIGIAGGVAYYLNKAPNPFVDKGIAGNQNNGQSNSSAPLMLAPGTKMQAASNQTQPTTNQQQNDKQDASAPNYDFYDVLQGKKDINPKPEASSVAAKPQGFIIQVGAFSEPDLANNLKAKMALLGYSVKIRQRQENGKTINKVMMGPFDSESQAQEILDQLKQQDIDGTIINLNQ
ncbi:MAG: SPOR domain-containing protein [Neisseriales bacterium]|nr:MAG: SPOR domain-containing protein [Neisseriales bacterium]